MRATEEQIRAMSQGKHQGGRWPFGGESRGATNIFQQRPIQSNQYGELREVTPNEYRELEELDITVSIANISQVPFFLLAL